MLDRGEKGIRKVSDLYAEEIAAYAIFGIILNFLFPMLFGLYLSKNIGMEEMVESRGEREQSWWMLLAMIVPFVKMFVTLYRIAILQFFFLNQGRSHKEFWIYLTHETNEHRS